MKRKRRVSEWLIPAGLYLAGLAHWAVFLDFGRIPTNLYDWDSVMAFLGVIRESVASGTIPFHVSEPLSKTDRFLAIPMLIMSPHILALPVLAVGRFVLLDVLVLFSVGYAGSLALKRALKWSWSVFVVFFLLFNFNGFMTAHLAVGHREWSGYFLLPWFILGLVTWVRRGPTVPVAISMALVLFWIGMQGFTHMAIWCLLFVLLLSVRSWTWIKHAVLVGVAWGSMSAVKVLPGLVAFGGFERKFLGGYNTIGAFVRGLVWVQPAHEPYLESVSAEIGRRLGWWEYDIYIGWFGLVFLLVFGLWFRFGGGRAMRNLKFATLDLPIAVMAALSAGRVYAIIYGSGLFSYDRVSTRFIILPLIVLIVLGCMRLDRWIRSKPLQIWKVWSVRTGIAGIVVGLAWHSWTWAIMNLKKFPVERLFVSTSEIVVMPDPGYKAAVIIGAIVTVGSMTLALGYLLANRRNLGRALFPGDRTVAKILE